MGGALAVAVIRPTRNQTVDEDELARLKRDYLPMWAELAYGSAVGRGIRDRVSFADFMKGTMREFDESGEGKPNHVACNIVETAIGEITKAVPLARSALCVRYLNARGPSVFRSGRLTCITMDEIEDVADEAERRLVPIVKRLGIPL